MKLQHFDDSLIILRSARNGYLKSYYFQMRYSRASYKFELANREEANPTATGVSENTGSGVRLQDLITNRWWILKV